MKTVRLFETNCCCWLAIASVILGSTLASGTDPIATTAIAPSIDVSCDFSSDLCGWYQDTTVQFQFQRVTGKVFQSKYTIGPSSAVEGNGYYLFYEDQTKYTGKARLLSPLIHDGISCFQFWYWMQGWYVSSLSVYVGDKAKIPSWSRSGGQGPQWISTHLELNSSDVSRLVIEAYQDNYILPEQSAIFALDNFKMTPGNCPSATSCNFEDHMTCGWQNDPLMKDNWQVVKSENTPWYSPYSGDHTYGEKWGGFLHVGDHDLTAEKKLARLLSSEFKLGQGVKKGCVRMWISTSGWNEADKLKFEVKLIPTFNGVDLVDKTKTLFSDENNKWQWHRLMAPLEHESTFRLSLEASGSFKMAGVNIDDLDVDLFEPCSMKCDFETDNCGWVNTVDKRSWQRNQGPTATPGTGPFMDHTLENQNGTYIYGDSSVFYIGMPTFHSDFLASSHFTESEGKACFRFWYHMHGSSTMGTLEVTDDRPQVMVFNVSGSQGNEWHGALVDLDASHTIMLQLIANIGIDGKGDIAIDDTEFLPGPCSLYKDTIQPKMFKCKSGSKTFSITKLCDFINDCPDGDDEENCGFNCDFESQLDGCSWYQIPDMNTLNWASGRGIDRNIDGPDVDHTTGTNRGGYQYLKLVNASKANDKTDLGILLRPTPEACSVTFWYNIYGDSTDELEQIDVAFGVFDSRLELESIPSPVNAKSAWKSFTYYIGPVRSDFTLILRGSKTNVTNGVVAIDDVTFDKCNFPAFQKQPCGMNEFKCFASGACIPVSSVCNIANDCGDLSDEGNCQSLVAVYCDFEDGHQNDFKVHSGSWSLGSNSELINPQSEMQRDHTTGLPSGHWMFTHEIGASILRSRRKYILNGTECSLNYFYYLSNVGSSLFAAISQEVDETTFDSSQPLTTPNSVGLWEKGLLKLAPSATTTQPFVIDFNANIEKFPGFVAIDDVTLTGDCFEYVEPVTTTTPSTTVPTTTTPTTVKTTVPTTVPVTVPTTTVQPIPSLTCDFNTDTCGWNLEPSGSEFKFQHVVGKVSPLGPETGHYLIFNDDTDQVGSAKVESGLQALDPGIICFRFRYWMNGKDVEGLSFDFESMTSGTQTVWNRVGTQGPKWVAGNFEVTPEEWDFFTLSIVARKSNGSNVVIALDDFLATPGNCQVSTSCNFEDHMLCGWQHGSTKWNHVRGDDFMTYGPYLDHTYGETWGSFMHVGDFNMPLGNDSAKLLSPEYQLVPGRSKGCFRMWVNTNGAQLVDFEVKLVPTRGQSKTIYTMSYNSAYWRRLWANLEVEGAFRISLEATGTFARAGFSFDDIDVNLFEDCNLNCDFEKGPCGWTNADGNWVKWVGHRGPTDTPGTGPSIDHTLGTTSGTYYYVESSNFPVWPRPPAIESEYLHPTNFNASNGKVCFQFWYHMYGGRNMGSLDVQLMRTDDKRYWSRSGNQEDEWHRGLVDLDISNATNPIVLQLHATIGRNGESDIAIDDTDILPGPCSRYNETVVPKVFKCKKGEKSIAMKQVCDFIKDCIDGEDEENCGFTCDFETKNENCSWYAIPDNKKLMWALGHGFDSNVTESVGPEVDHTLGTIYGGYKYLKLRPNAFEAGMTDFGVHVAPSREACSVSFWYNVKGASDLEVSLGVGDSRLVLQKIQGETDSKWKQYETSIGQVHTDFTLIIRGDKKVATSGTVAIDDVTLKGCMFPARQDSPCKVGEVSCIASGACLPASTFCDLINDCGDYSDEANCTANVPMYCDFENGDFCNMLITSGMWLLGSNLELNSVPLRDHTTGFHYGKWIYASPKGTSTLKSRKTYFMKDECSLRFYYQMKEESSLEVRLHRTSDGKVMPFGSFNGTNLEPNHWNKAEISLNHFGTGDAFAVEFAATNQGFNDYVAIDDVTMSKGCIESPPVVITTTTTVPTTTKAPTKPATSVPASTTSEPSSKTVVETTTRTTTMAVAELTDRERNLIIGLSVAGGCFLLAVIVIIVLCCKMSSKAITSQTPVTKPPQRTPGIPLSQMPVKPSVYEEQLPQASTQYYYAAPPSEQVPDDTKMSSYVPSKTALITHNEELTAGDEEEF